MNPNDAVLCLNALCNKANSKLYLCDFGMKLPKLAEILVKVGLQ